jgi:serine/threonine protein kinase
LQGALLLKGKGFDTARPFAALEHRGWRNTGISYYVAEEVADGQSLSAFWRDVVPTFSSETAPDKKRQILTVVASLFHRLHSQGIYHGDLKGSNILIRERDEGTWQCFLVDVDSVRKRRRLSWIRRIKNLVQLCNSAGRYFDVGEKTFFLNHYADLFHLPSDRRKTLASKVLSMSREWETVSLRKPGKQKTSW